MKFKNCVVGQRVKVKNSTVPHGNNGAVTFCEEFVGQEGSIVAVDDVNAGGLHVQVAFDGLDSDWGNHKDLKMIKGD